MTVKLKVDSSEFKKLVKQASRVADTVVTGAFTEFYRKTPIRSGNARSNTSLDQPNRTIHADYAYADRLDHGWSKQFGGVGMTKPTIDYIEKTVEKELRKL